MHARIPTAAVALAMVFAAPAAAATPTLPTVSRTVSAATEPGTACAAAPSSALRGGVARYRAPVAGFLNVTLDGKGDWDLALRDAAGRRLGASQGTQGHELVQRWVQAGDRIAAVACKRPGATGKARIAYDLVVTKPAIQQGKTRLVKVAISSQKQVQQLDALGLDVTHDQTQRSSAVVVNGDAQLATLKQTGLKYQVVENDLFTSDLDLLKRDAKRTSTVRAQARAAGATLPSGRTTYRTYDDIQTELKQIADANPGLVRPVSIGKSYQGRDINGLEIGNDVNGNDGRPVYFVMGVHHAREWPAAEAAMELANLLTKSRSTPRIAKLLATERIVIVPLVNPDGYVVSRGAFSPTDTIVDGGDPLGAGADYGQTVEAVAPPGGFGAYRRKNCDAENGMAMQPCETAYGVDNNRNYGNLWGGPGGSPDLTSQSYHGKGPRSEPETRAVFDYVRTHHVTTLITIHTVAGLVLRPPGLKQLGLAPDEPRMKQLGDAMADATGYVSQYSWQLYDTAGTTEDDTYAATGGYGYTYEMGDTKGLFHGPYADSVIAQWTGEGPPSNGKGGVQEALLLGAEAANNNPDHAVLTGKAPAGRILRLAKKFQTTTSEYCLMGVEPVLNVQAAPSAICPGGVQKPVTLDDALDATTVVPAGGKYEWHIGQSTRPFVGGGAVFEETKPDAQPAATISGTPGAPNDVHEDKFTLPAGKQAVTITLHPNVPVEDYDIELFYGGKSIGTSGNSPGEDEVLELSKPAAGEYTVKVSYFLAATGDYTTTVTTASSTRTVSTGTKEAYTLTCEDAAGTVYSSQSLIIDRGQLITDDLPCTEGGAAPIVSAPVTTSPGVGTPVSGGGTGLKALKFRVTSVRLKASHKGGIIVRVYCPKDKTAVCKGRVRLRGKLAAAKKTLTLASRSFKIKPGTSPRLRMTLTRTSFKALRRAKRLRVSLTASGTSAGKKITASKRYTLRRP